MRLRALGGIFFGTIGVIRYFWREPSPEIFSPKRKMAADKIVNPKWGD